jgi:hypothetical protein
MAMKRMGASAVIGCGGMAWYMGWLDRGFQMLGMEGAKMGQPPPQAVYPDPFYLPPNFKTPWPDEPSDMLKMLRRDGYKMRKIDLRNSIYAEAKMLHLLAEFATNAEELRIHQTLGTVTELDVARLLLKMPFLRLLELVRIDEGISDEVITSALEICKDLESIRISGAGGYERGPMTDTAMHEIAKRLGKQLKHLELSEDMPVSDAALRHLAANCPNLELLNVRCGWNAYTDDGVLDLLKGCRKLQSLDVAGMNNVTATLLAHVALPETAPSLKVLKVTPFEWGGKVDDQAIDDLRLLRPELQVYRRTTEGGASTSEYAAYSPFTDRTGQ